MLRNEAVLQTRQILDEHNLSHWKIRLSNDISKPWVGLCSHKDNTIWLNAHYIDQGHEKEISNTIRHEIAHALTPGNGHNEVWSAKARELGCDNTLPCLTYGLSAAVLDALRSGATLEVEVEEQVIRTPKYKVTRLQDKCPTCGKVAKEKSVTEIHGKKLILLECGHFITKNAESFSPFENIVFDGDEKHAHEWTGTKCSCGAKRLYPYQVDGAKFIERNNGRAGIFDEMGLGKTMQALAWLKYHPEAYPFVMIVKSGIKYQWLKESVRIMGFERLPQVITSSNDALLPLCGYIISYDMLIPKTRVNSKTKKVISSGFDIQKFIGKVKTVIMDECQAIKNPDSTRTQMVRQLIKHVQHVIPLSGTPWKNRGSEFFPVLNMLDPVRFNSFEGFKNRWVRYYWDGAHQKEGGIDNPEKFKEYVKDLVIRRERSEVMKELPVISRNALYCEMDETSSKAYSNEVNDFVKFWNTAVIGGDEDSFETAQGVLARLTRMRHITGLAKIPNTVDFVKEFLEDTDRKLVIFVHHKDVGQIIYDQIKAICAEINEPQPLKLTAELSAEERFRVQELFNGPTCRVLVASTLASGEGLNLQTCSDCIMHERQWNPANEEQAEGRFIRIGQLASAVTATYPLAGSIDNHFHSIVERKRSEFHAAMNKGSVVSWNEKGLIKELAEAIVREAKR